MYLFTNNWLLSFSFVPLCPTFNTQGWWHVLSASYTLTHHYVTMTTLSQVFIPFIFLLYILLLFCFHLLLSLLQCKFSPFLLAEKNGLRNTETVIYWHYGSSPHFLTHWQQIHNCSESICYSNCSKAYSTMADVLNMV